MSSPEKLWWIPDDTEVWTLAAQISEELPNGLVSFMVQKTQKVTNHQLQKCLPASRDSNNPEDLVYLQDVNQGSILHCIRNRFAERKIYTSIGMVLMTLNPFEVIGGLYGKNVVKRYEDPMDRTQNAHVYSIPSRAYYNMCTTGEDQSILISGESGAGKTEAAKHCLSFLTEVANERASSQLALKVGHNDSREEDPGLSITEIASRIIAASPILEAFGNAKTGRNPNSSRFGKWMVLNFDRHNVIHSASIVSYLLEKSRVTQREPSERSYHIFYQLLRGLERDQMRTWKMHGDTRKYRYLSGDNDQEAVDLNDSRNFNQTLEAFHKMGFTKEETMHYFQIVIAILEIGNIDFIPIRDGEGTDIKNRDLVDDISLKIGVNANTLAFSLCNKSFETGKTRKSLVTIQLNVQKAVETRDSLARSLYERLFTEIIASINTKSKINSHQDGQGRCIGLLDIFGFEIFTENSFEQLCINYCNEMLQHHFDYVIFTSEKNLYSEEGIVCETIEFKDNGEVIRDIESIFKALDEESRIPKGSAKQWYDKMKKTMKTVNVLFPPRRKGDIFLVKHYAGDVEYSPLLFLEKNIETLNNDLVGTMSCSTDRVMMRLFARTTEEAAKANDVNSSAGARRAGSTSSMTNRSLSWRFVQQLGSLMSMLRKTSSHFIRCIKSNEACMAQRFDATLVYKQLLYSGVFEVVKIQQSGLPCRMQHIDFLARYKCLVPSRNRWSYRSSGELLAAFTKLNYDLAHAKVGHNMIFFKSFEQKLLETKRDALLKKSASKFTCFLMKKKYFASFRKVLEPYRLFREGNEKLSSIDATPAYQSFVEAVQDFHHLCRRPCLEHVVDHMKHELSLLDQRVDLINDATQRLAHKTREGIMSLQDVLGRAIDLEITFHPIVVQCKVTSQQYYRAIEFVDIVHRSDPNIHDYTTNYDATSSMALNNLTAVQIEEGVELLQQFDGVVDDAGIALRYAIKYMLAVRAEISDIGDPLQQLLITAALKFDADAGIMIQAYGDEGLQAMQTLKDKVEALQDHVFNSHDVENIFLDAADYVMVVEDFVLKGDASSAIEILEAAAHRRVVSKVFTNQLKELHQWAEIQLSPEKLRELLLQGYVPGSETGEEEAVGYEDIEKLVERLKKLSKPTPTIEGVIRAGNWIVLLRKEFLAKNWDELERYVSEADQDGVDNNIFEDYQDCITELNNCQWQVVYHGFFSDVVGVISESIFRSVTMDSDSWHLMIADISDDLGMVAGIKSFVVAETAPRLFKLIPLLEDIVNLRSLVYSKEIDIALTVVQQIEAQYTPMMTEFNLLEAVSGELAACQKLLKKISLENALLSAMRLKKACPYLSQDDNVQEPYKVTCDLTETVDGLRVALRDLAAFAEKYDNQLESYIALAKKLLVGRSHLLAPEGDPEKAWKDLYEEFSKEESELIRETAVFYEFEDELNVVTEELHRRYLLVALLALLKVPTIVGEVDVNVHTEEKLLVRQFKTFNELMHDMKQTAYIYPKNLQNLALFVKLVLKFRKKILDGGWHRTELEQLIAYLHQIPHGGGMTEENVKVETTRVHDELEARRHIVQLRRALETIQVLHKEEDASTAAPNNPPADPRSNSATNAGTHTTTAANSATTATSVTTLEVNLEPLKAATAAVEKYRGVLSKKLVALAKQIVHIVEILLQNGSTRVDDAEIEQASNHMKELKLDATNVDMVFDNVRVHNFMKNIRNALVKHATMPEQLLQAIVQTRTAIKNLPVKYVPWLKAAYLYCDVCVSLQGEDWVRLVETTRKLDDFLTMRIVPVAEQEQKSSQTKPSNWHDIVKFIDVITRQKVQGYQVALQRKRLLDEAEQEKRTLQLSPVETQKAQVRTEDLQQNPYGLGQLRKAGFNDKKLSELPFEPRLFWAYDFDVHLLKKRGFLPSVLMEAGYTVQELYRGGYSVQDLYQSGIALTALELTPKELIQAGISIRDIIENMALHPHQIRDLERDAKKLLASGLGLAELMDAGFSLLELRSAGFNAAVLYHAGFDNVHDYLAAGYDIRQLAGIFPLQDLRRAGIKYAELKACGYSLESLLNAGFVSEVERDVLVQFYHAMSGETWRSRRYWLTDKPLDTWEGVTMEKNRVVALDLIERGLRGSVPAELALLRQLKSLHLSSNFITGRLPEKLLDLIEINLVETDLLTANLPPTPSQTKPAAPSRRVPPPPPPPFTVSAGAPASITGGNANLNRAQIAIDTNFHSPPRSESRRRFAIPDLPVTPKAHSMGSSSSFSSSDLLLEQRNVLLEFFHSLQGSGWKERAHWGSDRPLKEWFGVRTNPAGHVVEIVLGSNYLKGVLPASLGQLRYLQTLDLRLNQVHGVIPTALGQCLSLQILRLQSNKFIGGLPDSLSHLDRLEVIDVRHNLLEGQLPAGLGRLPRLSFLGLHSNHFNDRDVAELRHLLPACRIAWK